MQSHLQQCPLCRAELERVSTELAMVAMSVDQHQLPEGARQRFIKKITDGPANATAPVIAILGGRRIHPVAAWIPWTIAACLALTAVLLGIRIGALNREVKNQTRLIAELASTQSRAQRVLDVLTSPNAQHIVLSVSKTAPAPTARAAYLESRGELVFQASNMSPLPQGKTYELWIIPANGAAPIPAGLFAPDPSGSASVVLPPLPVGVAAKAFGVTVEQAEGSTTPTLPIILSGATPSS